MDPTGIVNCVDVALRSFPTSAGESTPHVAFLDRALQMLCLHHPSDAGPVLAPRMTDLLRLADTTTGPDALFPALLVTLRQSLPLGHDGSIAWDSSILSTLTNQAEELWRTRSLALPPTTQEFVSSLIQADRLSDHSVAIAETLVYLSPQAHSHFATWLIHPVSRRPVDQVIPVLQAFLDTQVVENSRGGHMAADVQAAVGHSAWLFSRLFVVQTSAGQKAAAAKCLSSIIHLAPEQAGRLSQLCSEAIDSAAPAAILNWDVVNVLGEIGARHVSWREPDGPVTRAVESGLKWLVRRFAEDPTDTHELLHVLRPFGMS